MWQRYRLCAHDVGKRLEVCGAAGAGLEMEPLAHAGCLKAYVG